MFSKKIAFYAEFATGDEYQCGYLVFEENEVRVVPRSCQAGIYSLDCLKIGKASVRAIDRIGQAFGLEGEELDKVALVPVDMDLPEISNSRY